MAGYDENKISSILKESKSVAVVGISEKPERDSYRVAKYLMEKGYGIIPVNPVIEYWEGIKSYKSLLDIPEDTRIDIVDIFRKSEAVLPIVQEAVKIHARTVWMQEGVINEEAAKLAKENSLQVVMDKCMMKEHDRLNTL